VRPIWITGSRCDPGSPDHRIKSNFGTRSTNFRLVPVFSAPLRTHHQSIVDIERLAIDETGIVTG
jgi:hypothetical protein